MKYRYKLIARFWRLFKENWFFGLFSGLRQLAQNVPTERTAIFVYFLPTKCSDGTNKEILIRHRPKKK